jgi:U3 small nucleolar RNA-associated protein 18
MFSVDMTESGNPVVKLPPLKAIGQHTVKDFAVSADGSYLALLGKYGFIHVLSGKNHELIRSYKMNANVLTACFSSNSTHIYSHGEGGQVYIFDLRAQKCSHKFYDDGCVNGTALDLSRDGRRIATGSDSGVANVYDLADVFRSSSPQPLKALRNLTTAITTLRFNGPGELLGFASDRRGNAIRLAHLRSMSVMQNFPEQRTRLSKTLALDFSPNGGYASIGNDDGCVKLFRLNHYASY